MSISSISSERHSVRDTHVEHASMFEQVHFSGNLIDKHVSLLKSNPHYRNVHIPEPDTIEPLEQKFPYVSERSLDFMKVSFVDRGQTSIGCLSSRVV
jgi:hypothetical protein